MPKLGDEIYGKEISKSARTKYIWVICKIYNNERWSPKGTVYQGLSRQCQSCNLKNAKTFRINPEKAMKEGRI